MPTDAQTTQLAIQRFEAAAEANLQTPGRQGCTIQIGRRQADDVIVGADLHGHRLNFQRLLQQADLPKQQRRHLVLQEVCHGGPQYPTRGCMSHLLLEDVARCKLEFPERVHFLLSNHELAEMLDLPIAKSSRMLNLQFRLGLEQFYGESAEQVRQAAQQFIRTCPLALRLENGVWISHSAPERIAEQGFDASMLRRELQLEDLLPGGDAFRVVWGRDFRQENADAWAEVTDCPVMVHGHEPCRQGYRMPNSRQLIIDSSREIACFLKIKLAQPATLDALVEGIGYL